ncbi:MAG TPA: cyclase family protein [Dehalococcoidia bacterium]|nr:cyclase family protein [Dehalococcoidia bacterium]
MKIYDVTVPLRAGMATYAGEEPGPKLDFHSLISEGKSANVSALSLGSHTGTHVDAPHHFLDNGVTMEQVPLEYLVGPAQVVEYVGEGHITAADLEGLGIGAGTTRLLIKTSNGRFWDDDEFHAEFVALDEDAGPWLVEGGIVLVGLDYMSIERFRSPTHAVHLALLKTNAVLLEGLDLRDVPPGEYFLVCAPLPVVGADGAPARVFLLDGVE